MHVKKKKNAAIQDLTLPILAHYDVGTCTTTPHDRRM